MPPSTAAPQSIYPGSVGVLLGTQAIPATPVTAANETIANGAVSRTVVVAARPEGHPSSQRQIIWQIFGSSSVTLALQGSIDGINFVTVDTFTGTASTTATIRPVLAEVGGTTGTVTGIVSSFRYWQVKNTGASPVSVTVTITCQ